MLPADRAEFRNLPLEEVVDGTYRNTARHIHKVDTLVFIAQGCQEETRQVSRQLELAKKKIAELGAALAEAEARREATEAGRLAMVEVLNEERAAHSFAKSALRASEVRLGEVQSEVVGLRYEGGVLRLKVEQLEARERRALERAEHAVDSFKESEEFCDMLEEETVDGFLRGFENFRRQMARFCPQLDLSTVRPRMRLGYNSDSDDVPAALASDAESAELDAAEPAAAVVELEGVPEAPAEAPAADLEPVPAEDPPVIAIDDPEGDAGATAAP
ncbi:uncharacterized protein LOC113461124 [Phoenix dactylifera]|uniref:Uncharacterized protein LOC113461124 n=1 Tax=Phoenix dactylifera TaxID=42345 RepID=A0A8B8IZJ1_PHODC|nr:uncharacterized protein LOC113461124 [Phoenix dactylifera]